VVTEQVPVDLSLPLEDWALGTTTVLASADAVALGFADAPALGVVLAWANPTSIRELAAVAAIRVGHRTMPGRRFLIKARTPRQIRRHHRHPAPRPEESLGCTDDNDVIDVQWRCWPVLAGSSRLRTDED
jgi:hypothetical protein